MSKSVTESALMTDRSTKEEDVKNGNSIVVSTHSCTTMCETAQKERKRTGRQGSRGAEEREEKRIRHVANTYQS